MKATFIAIIISSLSLIVAFCSLGWSIVKEFIYPRPIYRVRAKVVRLMDLYSDEEAPRFILVAATNFGPSDGRLDQVTVSLRSRLGKPHTYGKVKVMDTVDAMEPEFDAGYPSKVLIGETKKATCPSPNNPSFAEA